MLTKRLMGIIIIILALTLFAILLVIRGEVFERDAFLCEAVHSNPDIENASCPVHQRDLSSWFSAAFVLDILLLGAGAYHLIPSKIQRERSFKEIDISRLDKEEKNIYNLLKEHDGSMYQSDLVKETGFSKVHMTRVLDKLEHKGVLERKRRGMTNIIVLK